MFEFTAREDLIRLASPKARGEVFTKLMKIPGVQMIYVSALACTRHRNIDFIEMQRKGRLSYLLFNEVDMITGDYITKTKDAAAEIAAERSPSGIILLTGCQSALLSTDYKLLTEEIEQEIGVPIRVHDGCRLCGFDEENGASSSIDRLLYSFLRPAEKSEALSVNILGSAAPDEGSELFSILENAGVKKVNQLSACKTFAEYQEMSRAHLNILTSPQELEIGQYLQETLGIPYVCLGGIYDGAALEEEYAALSSALHCSIDISSVRDQLDQRLQAAKSAVTTRSIAVEGDAELAKWLLCEGFHVVSLSMNHHQGLTPAQRAWFAEHAGAVRIEASGRGGPKGVHGRGGPGGPGGPGGSGRPESKGGKPHGTAALKIGFAGSLAALDNLERCMGGARQ